MCSIHGKDINSGPDQSGCTGNSIFSDSQRSGYSKSAE